MLHHEFVPIDILALVEPVTNAIPSAAVIAALQYHGFFTQKPAIIEHLATATNYHPAIPIAKK